MRRLAALALLAACGPAIPRPGTYRGNVTTTGACVPGGAEIDPVELTLAGATFTVTCPGHGIGCEALRADLGAPGVTPEALPEGITFTGAAFRLDARPATLIRVDPTQPNPAWVSCPTLTSGVLPRT